jgi:hypothetical protein
MLKLRVYFRPACNFHFSPQAFSPPSLPSLLPRYYPFDSIGTLSTPSWCCFESTNTVSRSLDGGMSLSDVLLSRVLIIRRSRSGWFEICSGPRCQTLNTNMRITGIDAAMMVTAHSTLLHITMFTRASMRTRSIFGTGCGVDETHKCGSYWQARAYRNT